MLYQGMLVRSVEFFILNANVEGAYVFKMFIRNVSRFLSDVFVEFMSGLISSFSL